MVGWCAPLGWPIVGVLAGWSGDGEAHMIPDPCQMLADWATALLAGDEDDRASLVDVARSNQGDPAYAAKYPGRWARVDAEGVLTMVALDGGSVTVDRLSPHTGEELADSDTLATLDDLNLTDAQRAEVREVLSR